MVSDYYKRRAARHKAKKSKRKKSKKKPRTITFSPISLGGSPSRQNAGSKALDILSSVLLEPVTLVTKGPSAAGKLVKTRREEIEHTGSVSKAAGVVFETLTAATVGAALVGAAAAPATAAGIGFNVGARLLPKTLLGGVGAATGAGILITSSAARSKVADIAQDPTKIGREAGLLIDKAVGGKDVGGLGDAVKTAGLVGAGVVGTVAVLKGVDKVKDIFLGDKVADKVINSPSDVPTALALPSDSVPDALAPITDTPVVETTPKPVDTSPAQAINIKVINKPQVNVAMAQSI